MKKKRMISTVISLLLIISFILPTGVQAKESAPHLFFPYSTVYHATVVKGGSTTLAFSREDSPGRYYTVEIYKGSFEDIIKMEEPVPVETRDFTDADFDKSRHLFMTWKADARYSVGDYSLICYAHYGDSYGLPEQAIFIAPLHVISKEKPANDIKLSISEEGEYFWDFSGVVPREQEFILMPVLLPYANTTNRRFTFTDFDPDILSVSQSWSNYHGYIRIRGIRVGATNLTVDYGTIKKTFRVVVEWKGFRMEMKSNKATLCPGQTDTIDRKYYRDTPDKTWTLKEEDFVAPVWKSDNTKVATVHNGIVTAVAPGTAKITLTVGNLSKSLTYTVRAHQLDSSLPIVPKTATQPSYQEGHCSLCGKDHVFNIIEPAVFTDTKENAWYAEHVDRVYDLKLMNGTGEHSFAPNANVNRAMAATVLYRIAGEPEIEGESPFNDVPAGKYFTNAVIWAEKNGIVNGYPDGTFRPNDSITREQLAAILYRYAKSEGKAQAEPADLSSFPDAGKVHSYATEAMAWSVGAELINGVGSDGKSYLQPANNATRAQFATIISRYMESVDPLTPVKPEPALTEVQAFLIRSHEDGAEPENVKVSSTAELQQYLDDYHQGKCPDGFDPDKYGDTYFQNNALLFTLVRRCGGSPGFSIENVTENEEKIEVVLEKPGEPETPDECSWILVLELAKPMLEREVVVNILSTLGPDHFLSHYAESADELIEWTRAELVEPSEQGRFFTSYLGDAEKNRGILITQPATEEYAPWTIEACSEDSVVGFYFSDSQNNKEFDIYIDQSDRSLDDIIAERSGFYNGYFTDWEYTKNTVQINGIDTEIYSWGGMEYTAKQDGKKYPEHPTAYFEYMGHVVQIHVRKGLDKTIWDNAWLDLFTFEYVELTN